MNLSQIQAEAGRLLNDPFNTRWTPDIITARANIGQAKIQGYTNAVKTPESLTPVAGTRTITLDSDTMNIVRATKTLLNGSIKPFEGITREELDFRYPDWQQWQQGEPLFWFYDATNQQINLVPIPDATNAIVNGITVWESRKPADLANSTDIPFDSNNQMTPYHICLVYWIVSQCWADDGTPESLGKSKFFMSGSMLAPGRYEQEIGRILEEFDVPEVVPEQILWEPSGGRTGSWGFPSKSNPLPSF